MEPSEAPGEGVEDATGSNSPEVELVESPVYEWLNAPVVGGWSRARILLILGIAFVVVLAAYAVTIPATSTPPPSPPPPTTGTLSTCAVNKGYDGARFKVWIDGDMVKNEYMSPDDYSCLTEYLDPRSHRVLVACDFTVRYDDSVMIVAGKTVQLPEAGYDYICY